jgi:hypothetical protein
VEKEFWVNVAVIVPLPLMVAVVEAEVEELIVIEPEALHKEKLYPAPGVAVIETP